MRSFLICLVALSLLLVGCGETVDDVLAGELASAVESLNAESRIAGSYMLEITFGERNTLYYAIGDIECDRAERRLHASFDQTYLGASAEAENYIADGKIVSIIDGETLTEDCDPVEYLSKFPYCTIPAYSEAFGEIVKGENMSGTTYSYDRNDGKELFDILLGGDIYSLAMIKNPQPDKAVYGDVTTTVTAVDGKAVSCRYEFDIKLYDTPSAVSGYTPPESEYTVELHVVARVSYDSFGADVEIAEYSEKAS